MSFLIQYKQDVVRDGNIMNEKHELLKVNKAVYVFCAYWFTVPRIKKLCKFCQTNKKVLLRTLSAYS